MPFLNVKVSRPASPALVREISRLLLDHTTDILRKDPHVTAIAIDFVPPEHWVVAGSTLAEQGKSSFYFDIRVTDGTNTKDEKARYVKACFRSFAQLLGDLHDESYIHVIDARADAYGFGGLTQEYRYVKAQEGAGSPA